MSDLTPKAAGSADTGADPPNLAFEIAGMRIGIWWGDLKLAGVVAAVLPPGWKPAPPHHLDSTMRLEWRDVDASPARREGYHWFSEDTFLGSATSPEQAVRILEDLVEHLVAEHSPDFLFMHAGVVRWRDLAIVLPGPSHAGKSTLVNALVREGAMYYSDEWAVLDETGTVYPYPRHLSLREGPFGPAGRVDLGHLAPGGHPGESGIPVGLVLLCKFEADGDLRLDQLGAGEAMMAMSQHIVGIRHRPAATMTTLARIAAFAPVFQGTRGDAAAAARRILEAVDAAVTERDPHMRGTIIQRTLQGDRPLGDNAHGPYGYS